MVASMLASKISAMVDRCALVATLIAALTSGGCESLTHQVANNEDNLAAAGFIVKPANTPQRQAMLNRLPPHQFVKRMHEDTVQYVYADPLVCDCLYVGSQEAYGAYKRYLQQKNLADEQEATAQMYSDPAWNWGMWGPWGPSFGFGYGIGW